MSRVKKTAALLMLLLMIFALSACSPSEYFITDVTGRTVSRVEVTELSTGESRVIYKSTGNAAALIRSLRSIKVTKGEACDETADGHMYQVDMYVKEEPAGTVYINEDGSLCADGVHGIPAEGYENGIDMYIWSLLFKKEAEDEPIEQGAWQPKTDAIDVSAAAPAPAITRWVGGETVVETEENKYLTSVLEINRVKYAALTRVDREGRGYVLFGVQQNSGGNWTVNYSVNSYEQSGKTMLYFTLENADNGQCMLYGYDMSNDIATRILDLASSNMLVYDEESGLADGYGWVVHNDSIMAVRLSEAVVDESRTYSLSASGGMDYMGNHFFENVADGYDIKFTTLSIGNGGDLVLNITNRDSTKANADWVVKYGYDRSGKSIYAIGE